MADLFTVQMLTRFRERPSRWFALLGFPFLLMSLAAISLAGIAGSGMVIPATVAFISMTTFGFCVLLGVLGEAAIEHSRGGGSSHIMYRDRTEA